MWPEVGFVLCDEAAHERERLLSDKNGYGY